VRGLTILGEKKRKSSLHKNLLRKELKGREGVYDKRTQSSVDKGPLTRKRGTGSISRASVVAFRVEAPKREGVKQGLLLDRSISEIEEKGSPKEKIQCRRSSAQRAGEGTYVYLTDQEGKSRRGRNEKGVIPSLSWEEALAYRKESIGKEKESGTTLS